MKVQAKAARLGIKHRAESAAQLGREKKLDRTLPSGSPLQG